MIFESFWEYLSYLEMIGKRDKGYEIKVLNSLLFIKELAN